MKWSLAQNLYHPISVQPSDFSFHFCSAMDASGMCGRQHLDAGLRAGREPFVRTPELALVHVYMGAKSGGRGMECGVRVLLTVKST